MILDGYAAYLFAKQKALETGTRQDVYSCYDRFIIIPAEEAITNYCMHIIRVEPIQEVMTREEYMRWL